VEYINLNVIRAIEPKGQSSRAIFARHKKHIRYIRNNNSISAYTMHIVHNRHQFGPADETLKLLKPCNKGTKMSCWEALYMHMHYKQGILIPKQQVTDTNPLFDLAAIPRDLQATSTDSSSQTVVPYTHTHTHTHHWVSPDQIRSLAILSSSQYFRDTILYDLTFIFILHFKIRLPNTD